MEENPSDQYLRQQKRTDANYYYYESHEMRKTTTTTKLMVIENNGRAGDDDNYGSYDGEREGRARPGRGAMDEDAMVEGVRGRGCHRHRL